MESPSLPKTTSHSTDLYLMASLQHKGQGEGPTAPTGEDSGYNVPKRGTSSEEIDNKHVDVLFHLPQCIDQKDSETSISLCNLVDKSQKHSGLYQQKGYPTLPSMSLANTISSNGNDSVSDMALRNTSFDSPDSSTLVEHPSMDWDYNFVNNMDVSAQTSVISVADKSTSDVFFEDDNKDFDSKDKEHHPHQLAILPRTNSAKSICMKQTSPLSNLWRNESLLMKGNSGTYEDSSLDEMYRSMTLSGKEMTLIKPEICHLAVRQNQVRLQTFEPGSPPPEHEYIVLRKAPGRNSWTASFKICNESNSHKGFKIHVSELMKRVTVIPSDGLILPHRNERITVSTNLPMADIIKLINCSMLVNIFPIDYERIDVGILDQYMLLETVSPELIETLKIRRILFWDQNYLAESLQMFNAIDEVSELNAVKSTIHRSISVISASSRLERRQLLEELEERVKNAKNEIASIYSEVNSLRGTLFIMCVILFAVVLALSLRFFGFKHLYRD